MAEPYGTQPHPPEPPDEPDNLVDDELGADARASRPQAPRWHGGIRDPGHAAFYDIDHRYLPDPADPLDQPERRQVVDDYDSLVHGAGARTHAEHGGADPASGGGPGDPRSNRPDAEAGSV